MHLGTFQISQNIQQHAAPSQFAARTERPKNPWLSAKLFAAQTSARDAKREKVTPSRRQHRYAARPVRITASWHSAHLFVAQTLCTRREPAISELQPAENIILHINNSPNSYQYKPREIECTNNTKNTS